MAPALIANPEKLPAGSRVLITWELGANLGHLTSNLTIARLCVDKGLKVTMAVPVPETARRVLKAPEIEFIQAPLMPPQRLHSFGSVRNYSDMLLRMGWSDTQTFQTSVDGWRALIQENNLGLMVYNHAPTALVAARLEKIKVALLGTYFSLPPVRTPLPSFQPWNPVLLHHLHRSDRDATASINRIFRRSKQASIAHISDLFGQEKKFITTFRELDPFGPRADAEYIGPINSSPVGRSYSWDKQAQGSKIFLYFQRNTRSLEKILTALCGTKGAQFICVIPGFSDEMKKRFHPLRILSEPGDVRETISEANVVVTYGGTTMVSALLSGTPVIMFPQVIEQYLAARQMAHMGAGVILSDNDIHRLPEVLRDIRVSDKMGNSAKAFASKHANYNPLVAAHRFAKCYGIDGVS